MTKKDIITPMKIVPKILEKIESSHGQVVVVTKYFDATQTREVLNQLKKHPSFLALGENRIGEILKKDIPRKYIHFIGNIQSRNIPDILKHCSVVHSLCTEKHARKLHESTPSNSPSKGEKMGVFIQVNISREPQKSGVFPEDLEKFVEQLKPFKKLNILGISAMGAGGFSEESKRAEFRELLKLRDKYLPDGKISAGTSRDFEIALEEGIEIVRVGQAIFDL